MGGDDATGLTAGQDGPNKDDKDAVQVEKRCQNKLLKLKVWIACSMAAGQAVSVWFVRDSTLYYHNYITLTSPLFGHQTASQNSSS